MPERLDAGGDRWRYRCPEGHPSLSRTQSGRTAYCGQCDQSYQITEVVDEKHDRTLPEGFQP